MQTTKETIHEADTNRYTFSLISDVHVEKLCFFFHVELNFLINN